ncbi:hypothetical protein [Papillibacter cinnamivorans]|uniref:Uncharacterized protein n=1 Tax=Papillibacter cinnamivorans DSM 12816 TaxID=1122930 RepID=A0A1W2C9W6_9FIRM|nr:hypothetical protein [Papillibacter cinnamivorans]SMC81973.1 hypothetical protein SAMN02745168_2687 [Papillibacter cinnamivorans DSM 12816]
MVRPAMFLIVSFSVRGKTPFRITLPFPIFLVLMLSDEIADLMSVLALFSSSQERRKTGNEKPKVSLKTIRSGAVIAHGLLLGIMAETGGWSLAEVETEDMYIKISVV